VKKKYKSESMAPFFRKSWELRARNLCGSIVLLLGKVGLPATLTEQETE
jgi:hypothetical protein